VLRPVVLRVLSLVVVLWGTVTLAFLAIHAIPGDPVQLLIGPRDIGPEARARIVAEWGLDRPLPVQYLDYLWGLLQGDLGYSYVRKRPVADIIAAQLWPTVELALAGLLVAVGAALLSAVPTAGRRRAGSVARTAELVIVSTPEFWLGLVLLFVFSFTLSWFPVAGADGFRALVLPALALGLGTAAMLAQLLREGMADALDEPFVLTARARGIGDGRLRVRHVLRNAAVAPVAMAGFAFGNLLGGAVIVEQVFGRPGVGRIALQAIEARDVPTLLGIALLAAFAFVVVTTVVELTTLLIDPRLRARAVS